MAKRFSPEFKQQAIDYALSNSHESVAAIAQKLGAGYSTLDKWIRVTNPISSSKHQLSPVLLHKPILEGLFSNIISK